MFFSLAFCLIQFLFMLAFYLTDQGGACTDPAMECWVPSSEADGQEGRWNENVWR